MPLPVLLPRCLEEGCCDLYTESREKYTACWIISPHQSSPEPGETAGESVPAQIAVDCRTEHETVQQPIRLV